MKKLIVAASAMMIMAAANVQAADGQSVYQTACFACHGTGAAGAPKVGDKAEWKARIAQGMATLNDHAIKGFKGSKGFMPAKGGRSDLDDAAVKAAVKYMVDQSK
ncbi:MAG: c-type cytochrome [Gammaproteobacteria bacterium]|nr:c-type cytochrome [Gammaproteobacteria bacterium]MDH5650484.1 c-type cytochrome [Gammaproteobacteria bacterium]